MKILENGNNECLKCCVSTGTLWTGEEETPEYILHNSFLLENVIM